VGKGIEKKKQIKWRSEVAKIEKKEMMRRKGREL
jgi:hypothetical protein